MSQRVASSINAIAEASWLGADRARAYLIILAAISAGVAAVYLGLSSPLHDPLGKALGTDFASFWTASQLALSGAPAAAWDLPLHQKAQADMFGAGAGYAAFFYPPPFLLVCLPLALLPYAVSLAAWLAVTAAGWAVMVRAWMGRWTNWLAVACFPAALVNAGHGQNGFLTAGLFGAAAWMAERRPWLSGVLFGALIIKPHLAVLAPAFLMFTGNWRAFSAAALTAGGLCLASLVVLGGDSWLAFLDGSSLARAALEQDLVGYAKMQSVYAAARLAGADNAVAWMLQGSAIAVALAVLWRTRKCADAARGATLACATLVSTPFLLDYDLTLLAVPLAWLVGQGLGSGFRPWEKLAIAAVFMLPWFARPLAGGAGLALAPVLIFVLLTLVVRRSLQEQPQSAPAAAPSPQAAPSAA